MFAAMAEELSVLVRQPTKPQRLLVEVSAGELLDKLSILGIKSQRIANTAKQRNVEIERIALAAARQTLPPSKKLAELEKQLIRVNEQLWDFEDAIRDCERQADFGQRFIELARSVYRTNDRALRSNERSTNCSARQSWRRRAMRNWRRGMRRVFTPPALP